MAGVLFGDSFWGLGGLGFGGPLLTMDLDDKRGLDEG